MTHQEVVARPVLTVVLCEARAASDAQRRLERGLADALAARPDVAFAVLPHLYDLAPGGPAVQFLQSIPGPLAVLGWLYPRAAYWVLHANGIEDRPDRIIRCFDLRGQGEGAEVLAEIDRICIPHTGCAGCVTIEETVVPRWYPVIDQRRCTNCLECLNFCLFGVFGLDNSGKVFVEQPDACRDGCPACSRICPPGAIMFPEHPDPAIAGGAIAGDSFAPPTHQEGDGLDRLIDELDESDL
ncbi:MAG: ferredoxin family protein [Thermoguttaceae bacterium]|jgi:hypothetical protein